MAIPDWQSATVLLYYYPRCLQIRTLPRAEYLRLLVAGVHGTTTKRPSNINGRSLT
jgi:hypothetical protein